MKAVILLIAIIAIAYGSLHRAVKRVDVVEREYIVVFNQNTTQEIRNAHITEIKAQFAATESIKSHYAIEPSFWGYSGVFDKHTLHRIMKHPAVQFVEENQKVNLDQTFCNEEVSTQIWHLERISEVENVYDNDFFYPSDSGLNIYSYIVDTGILITHVDFGPAPGRATWGVNYIDSTNTDCNGHGTHVASSVAGTTYGSAKSSLLVAVKVLNCAGSGTYDAVISGINWAALNSRQNNRKSTMNLSLGGGYSLAVNQAIIASATDVAAGGGLFVAVAAGNNNADACTVSPSSACGEGTDPGSNTPYVWSVGAIDRNDLRATFSNFGQRCNNIWAPGVSVTGAWIGSNTATTTISGTSMASPQVAGVAGWYWSQNYGFSVSEVRSGLFNLFQQQPNQFHQLW